MGVETGKRGGFRGREVLGVWAMGVERDGEKTSSASAETDAPSSSGLLLPQRGPARAVEVERHEVGGRFIREVFVGVGSEGEEEAVGVGILLPGASGSHQVYRVVWLRGGHRGS